MTVEMATEVCSKWHPKEKQTQLIHAIVQLVPSHTMELPFQIQGTELDSIHRTPMTTSPLDRRTLLPITDRIRRAILRTLARSTISDHIRDTYQTMCSRAQIRRAISRSRTISITIHTTTSMIRMAIEQASSAETLSTI